jgi:spore coat protein CotH
MISGKHINLIIIGVLIIAVIFTGIITFLPDSIGIQAQSLQSEYATKLFDKSKIISIDIKADEDDWAKMLENAQQEEYISCDVTVNGTTFKSVGIRPKGNSSLSMVAGSDSDRFSFKFEFDHYIDGQTCFGLDKFVINNIQSDATYMKDYLSYDLMSYIGVASPLYAYTNVKVNGKDWGFYIAVESIEESFAERNFGSDYGKLYKPESMGMRGNGVMNDFINNDNAKTKEDTNDTEKSRTKSDTNNKNSSAKTSDTLRTGNANNGGPGDFAGGMKNGFGGGGPGGSSGGGSDLKYTDDSVSSYSNIFDNEVFKSTESDYQRVITAIKNLNSGTDLEKYIDVDKTLRYFAANTVLVNLDSYFSSMKHNYYLYEKDGQLTMLPWDYNLAFGGFQSGSASSAVNFSIDTPVSGVEMSERPILAKLLEVDEYKAKYHEYLQQIVDGYFNSGVYENTITNIDKLISEYVKNDASAFYDFDQYNEAVQMIKEFGKLRAQSIQGQLDGTIPSTTEGQSGASDKLIDASSINLSVMGSQGGRGMGQLNANTKGTQKKSDSQKEGDTGQTGSDQQQGMQQIPDTQQSGSMQPPDGANQQGDMQPPDGQGNMQPPDGTQQQGNNQAMNGGQQGNMQPPGEMQNMPDADVMMQAMQIIREANGSDLTEDQLAQLKKLGLTDDQITSIQKMSAQFGNQGGMPPGGGGMQPNRGPSEQSADINSLSSTNIIVLAASTACLLAGLVFVVKFKRRKYI